MVYDPTADNIDDLENALAVEMEKNAVLRAKLEAARAEQIDAQRYRWLREQNSDPVYADCVVINWNVGHDWTTTNDLDAAIDAAIRAQMDTTHKD